MAPQAFAKTPRVVFSGIQPSGIPHIGNYFGALRNWVCMQGAENKDTPILYSIVDLHSLTLPKDPKILNMQIKRMAASLLAIGIDPNRTILFRQSKIHYHSQLAWLLACQTPMSWLVRMTQWKSKLDIDTSKLGNNPSSQQAHDNLLSASLENAQTSNKLKMGLFTYPILQAADILIYKGNAVPVGQDQKQHLELANNIGRKFNHDICIANKKDPIFPYIEPLLTKETIAQRIMSLTAPSNKMSKSDPKSNSRIDITDSPELIKDKIKRAVTDSEATVGYNNLTRPGVSNLITLYAVVKDISLDEASNFFEGKRTSDLKRELTDALIDVFNPIRIKYEQLMNDQEYLETLLLEGELKSNEMAELNYKEIAEALGIN